MNNEFIGQMIVCTLISLITGGLGFVQYKSDTPFNVGFNKDGYDRLIVSKIMGIHVMIFSVLVFIYPMIFNKIKEIENYNFIAGLFVTLIIIMFLISINISIHRRAKITPKIIKTND